MPFDIISKNKMHFYKAPWNMSDDNINKLSYWFFEEIIKKVNAPDNDKKITIAP